MLLTVLMRSIKCSSPSDDVNLPLLSRLAENRGLTIGYPFSVATRTNQLTVSTGDLSRAFTRLAHDFDGSVRAELRSNIVSLCQNLDYRGWLAGESHYLEPPHISSELFRPWIEAALGDLNLMESLGFQHGGQLTVKFHEYAGKYFCTDGLWVPKNERVFPFEDESSYLTAYSRLHGLDGWASYLIDPATGPGHHPLALSSIEKRVGMDLNPRSLIFAGLNSHINADYGATWVLNDIQQGVPKAVQPQTGDKVLYLADMPFAISPLKPYPGQRGLFATNRDSGDWSLTFHAVKAFHAMCHSNPGADFRGVLLAYSLANPDRNLYQVREWAQIQFPDSEVMWTEVDAKMWRVRGVKGELNPMPLNRMSEKAYDEQFADDAKREGRIYEWHGYAEDLLKEGWTHISYGIVDIKP